jgi:hypothetical protein
MDFRKLVVAVMTVDREPAYVHQTLASLFASDGMVHEVSPIHLMIDASDTSYLGGYRHHRDLSLHPLSSTESERIAKWSRHRRFCRNYVRCLSLPIPEGGGICVCEDDLVFRDLFIQRLLMTVGELEASTGASDYCLALFTDCDLERDVSFYRGRYFCSYGWPFHGTQCMYYPRQTALQIRDYVQERGVDRTDDCGDLLIGKLYQDRMYACPRSLANHVGVVSTGLGGGGRAPGFSRPYRPISREEWGKGI